MSHQLTFDHLVNYDPGHPGISVTVTLETYGASVSCEAKLDSGSSFCIFSRKTGEELGLEVEAGIRRIVGTVTGSFAVYLHEVNLSIAGCSFTVLVGFAEDAIVQRNVLGRRGFLEQVILGLIDYEGKLYLGAYGQ